MNANREAAAQVGRVAASDYIERGEGGEGQDVLAAAYLQPGAFSAT